MNRNKKFKWIIDIYLKYKISSLFKELNNLPETSIFQRDTLKQRITKYEKML